MWNVYKKKPTNFQRDDEWFFSTINDCGAISPVRLGIRMFFV